MLHEVGITSTTLIDIVCLRESLNIVIRHHEDNGGAFGREVIERVAMLSTESLC